MNKLEESPDLIVLRQNMSGVDIKITAVKGSNYSEKMQAGPFIFNVLPQIAVWTEDSEGNLLETLYISGADYKKLRNAEKNESGGEFYRKFLPRWAAKAESAQKSLPSKESPYPDSVTSATPSAGFELQTRICNDESGIKPMMIYLEINKGGDFNETFTEEAYPGNGQPSLIYSADISEKSGKIKMTLNGYIDGNRINPDLSDFDTALNQIESLSVSFP